MLVAAAACCIAEHVHCDGILVSPAKTDEFAAFRHYYEMTRDLRVKNTKTFALIVVHGGMPGREYVTAKAIMP